MQSKYGLSPDVRATIENRFTELVYARKQSSFDILWHGFKVYLSKVSHKLMEYFEKHWFPCYLQWSNVGRAHHFSCGNTTTNRVESNWTQVKATIGAKTGIDKCVSAFIQHQVSIFCGLQSALSKVHARLRILTRVPSFLHSVATRMRGKRSSENGTTTLGNKARFTLGSTFHQRRVLRQIQHLYQRYQHQPSIKERFS